VANVVASRCAAGERKRGPIDVLYKQGRHACNKTLSYSRVVVCCCFC
jgi:hypothetical protein